MILIIVIVTISQQQQILLVLIFYSCTTNCHKLNGSKQHKSITISMGLESDYMRSWVQSPVPSLKKILKRSLIMG